MTSVIGLMWLVLFAGILAIIHRRLHFETQSLFLQITHRKEIALILYSLILLPGVFMHECSHFLMARILGVKTGRFSLIPRAMPDGRLRLGFIETASTDFIRDGLIGIAPFLVGGAFVVHVALNHLGLSAAWEGVMKVDFEMVWEEVKILYSRDDFWLWFYLTFAVSSTMLPSASDRRAWFPLGILIAGFFILLTVIGKGDIQIGGLVYVHQLINQAIRAVNLIFLISLFIHVVVLSIVWIIRNTLVKLNHLEFLIFQ
jgi:hypothetical protein